MTGICSRILLALLVCFAAVDAMAKGPVSVKGYYRKDGTYVRPHMRSSPDSSFSNNYSTYGNVNPYTGEPGTVKIPGSGGSGSSVTGDVSGNGKTTSSSGKSSAPTKVDEREALSWLRKGQRYMSDGKSAEAAQWFLKVVEEAPETESAQYIKKNISTINKKLTESTTTDSSQNITHTQTAATTPDNEAIAESRLRLAKNLIRQGRKDGAIAFLNKLAAEYPNTRAAAEAQEVLLELN